MGDKEDIELGERIVAKLRAVIDPETYMDVISMDLIRDLEVEDGRVSFKFRPSAPTCPLGIQLAYNIKNAVESVPGVEVLKMTVIDYIMADSLNEMLAKSGKGENSEERKEGKEKGT